MFTVFAAHAPADAGFSHSLNTFLETGCDSVYPARDSVVKPGQDLIDSAEIGVSADVLLLVLSRSSMPKWVRERWEPVLFDSAAESGTRVGVVLLEPCDFPALLRRKLKFFDATGDRLAVLRQIKRWINGVRHGAEPDLSFTEGNEPLYAAVADAPGMCTVTCVEADAFEREASWDFEAVIRVASRSRSLAEVAGDLGAALGLVADGPLEENCRRIRAVVGSRRCLIVYEGPRDEVEPLAEQGRSSFLFIGDACEAPARLRTFSAGRSLVRANRLAEAYDIFSALFHAGIEIEACARELVWICDHWNRYEEASALRNHFRLAPSEQLLFHF